MRRLLLLLSLFAIAGLAVANGPPPTDGVGDCSGSTIKICIPNYGCYNIPYPNC